ncbi:hypothetical protein GGR50DRAFT_688664 [Xylaria sp. CBS 124048]|nr:hypothetical protein GGR50DRAFT_688664 [Xylaria sp. CBS 124048]
MPLLIPHPNTPLHLYRHLLREATYLPVLCRPWITTRIQDRFRDCRYRDPAEPYIKQAHGALRSIRSANAGHIDRLERLCYMATGRVGKRRRILGATMLSAQAPPSDTDELEKSRVDALLASLADSPDDDPASPSSLQTKHTWLENWSLDMITAIAKSQVKQQSKDWPQHMRRQIDPDHVSSGTNCFGKPIRPKRIQNRLKRHWAAVLHQLLPPLPQNEWERLERIVTGDPNVSELQIPSRRPVAQPIRIEPPDPASEKWDWSLHVIKPARVIERGSTRKRKSLSGHEEQDPRGPARPIGVYIVTPRRLQRIYRRIWEMTPMLKPNTGNQKWSVTWGQKETQISPPSTRDLLFFEGVADDGSTGIKSSTGGNAARRAWIAE